jgi:hypothetical protein
MDFFLFKSIHPLWGGCEHDPTWGCYVPPVLPYLQSGRGGATCWVQAHLCMMPPLPGPHNILGLRVAPFTQPLCTRMGAGQKGKGGPFPWGPLCVAPPHTKGGRGTSTPPVCLLPFLWPLPWHTPAPLGVHRWGCKRGGGGMCCPCLHASPSLCPCARPPSSHTHPRHPRLHKAYQGGGCMAKGVCGSPHLWDALFHVHKAGRGWKWGQHCLCTPFIEQGWVAPSPTWQSAPAPSQCERESEGRKRGATLVHVLCSCAWGTKGGGGAAHSHFGALLGPGGPVLALFCLTKRGQRVRGKRGSGTHLYAPPCIPHLRRARVAQTLHVEGGEVLCTDLFLCPVEGQLRGPLSYLNGGGPKGWWAFRAPCPVQVIGGLGPKGGGHTFCTPPCVPRLHAEAGAMRHPGGCRGYTCTPNPFCTLPVHVFLQRGRSLPAGGSVRRRGGV